MTIRRREGNRPDRRIVDEALLDRAVLKALLGRLTYVGSANHKRRPGDYGFQPSHNPRPSKSLCDGQRRILRAGASALFGEGIQLGMVSRFADGGNPKYIWAVDSAGEVYEAKARPERETDYHGYRLGLDDSEMRNYVLKEWKRRCR